MSPVSDFISTIQKFRTPLVFNPWSDVDPENDFGPDSPAIRSRQLEAFLTSRIRTARYCLLGEALSYQGGHFSGIAMMSERILLGHNRGKGLEPERILPGLKARQTSKPEIQPKGFTEHTASMVWGLMTQIGIPPEQVLTWNSFAWHPYKEEKGLLSNRRPSLKESTAGLEVLQDFMKMFPKVELIAVGKVAEHCLGELGVKTECVRHPAMGGANQFRAQMKKILECAV